MDGRLRCRACEVVADCAGGTDVAGAAHACSAGSASTCSRVNNRLDETSPTQSLAAVRADLHRLGELVSSFGAAFGVRFDPVGERIALVDDKGSMVNEDRALLVVLDLIAAERRGGRVALPVTTTRVAEDVCRYHGVEVDWTPTSLHGLYHGGGGQGRDLRGRRQGRLHRAQFLPVHRRDRGLHAAARARRPDQADPQPDQDADPGGKPAQAVHADTVGGQGHR